MKFFEYLKDRILFVILYLVKILFFIAALKLLSINKEMIYLLALIDILIGSIILFGEYYRKKKFYNGLLNNIENLDKKYYVQELIKEPTTYEEKIIYDVLYEINKSMIENVNMYQQSIVSYKDFIEMWIHEVKLPISSLILKCHNNKEKYDTEFLDQVNKLDNYIDLVLYYVRSENFEKDFIIKENKLADIIRKVSLKNKDCFLENSIELNIDNLGFSVNTDSKWLEFIVNQIVSNSIKYRKEKNALIKIWAANDEKSIRLNIWDNGIGISGSDLPRVFEKSFTGNNGRNSSKSTGMGLYIVKQLCDKLGHRLEINSTKDEFTCITITFGKNEFYKMK